jgi:hypothetical protein
MTSTAEPGTGPTAVRHGWLGASPGAGRAVPAGRAPADLPAAMARQPDPGPRVDQHVVGGGLLPGPPVFRAARRRFRYSPRVFSGLITGLVFTRVTGLSRIALRPSVRCPVGTERLG